MKSDERLTGGDVLALSSTQAERVSAFLTPFGKTERLTGNAFVVYDIRRQV